MSREIRLGAVKIATERAGTPGELARMLSDFENAYVSLYRIDVGRGEMRGGPRRMMVEYAWEFGFPGWPEREITAESMTPEHRLLIKSVRIESPGFWEFAGSLNPLQQIREYLNDRHRRRQDKDWREASERERLILENRLIQNQVLEGSNTFLRERIALLRDLGFSAEDIRQWVWASVGSPLTQLGRHQDSRLIEAGDDEV